jgi:hypothetical protein
LATTYATVPSVKYDEDLMIQAQVCAAINRHAIYTSAAAGEVQYNHDATRFFKIAPFNQYVNFFHSTDVSYQSQTYAFAYDDVGDQSSTIQCTFPTKVTVVIGGYGEVTPTPITIPAKIEAEAYTDMSGVQTEPTNDGGTGLNVGYIDANDWMEYKIIVPEEREYNLKLRVASKDGDGLLKIIKGIADTVQVTIPKTGDWQAWTTLNTTINLTKGQKTIKLLVAKGGFNLNWIEFENSTLTNLEESLQSTSTLSVFPSPAKNELHLNRASENSIVTIWNLTGVKLLETQSNTVDVSSFQSGVYLVKCENQTGKFIKE